MIITINFDKHLLILIQVKIFFYGTNEISNLKDKNSKPKNIPFSKNEQCQQEKIQENGFSYSSSLNNYNSYYNNT